jgi:hypothetical protein
LLSRKMDYGRVPDTARNSRNDSPDVIKPVDDKAQQALL